LGIFDKGKTCRRWGPPGYDNVARCCVLVGHCGRQPPVAAVPGIKPAPADSVCPNAATPLAPGKSLPTLSFFAMPMPLTPSLFPHAGRWSPSRASPFSRHEVSRSCAVASPLVSRTAPPLSSPEPTALLTFLFHIGHCRHPWESTIFLPITNIEFAGPSCLHRLTMLERW
jgi:hypothetical protein